MQLKGVREFECRSFACNSFFHTGVSAFTKKILLSLPSVLIISYESLLGLSGVKLGAQIRLFDLGVIGPVTPVSLLSLAPSYCLSSMIHREEGGRQGP